MKFKALFLLCLFCFSASFAYAACLGSKHVIGTSGTTELCRKEARLNQELREAEEEADFERKEDDIQRRIDKAKNRNNSGQSSSSARNIINLGANLLGGSALGGESATPPVTPLYQSPITKTVHQFELNYSAYIFPSMAGFERQMPQIRPNAFSWVYNLSKTFAVVGMYQLFTLKGAQFDPITEDREVDENIEVVDPDTGEITIATRKTTKTFTVYQPGATSAEYTRFMYFVQISGEIGEQYAIYSRLGSGLSKAKVEYTIIDDAGKETKESEEYTSNQPWAFEFGLRRMFGGINTGFYTRIVEGDNGESDYLKYIDMSTIEFGVNVTFGLPSLGTI